MRSKNIGFQGIRKKKEGTGFKPKNGYQALKQE